MLPSWVICHPEHEHLDPIYGGMFMGDVYIYMCVCMCIYIYGSVMGCSVVVECVYVHGWGSITIVCRHSSNTNIKCNQTNTA